MRNLIRRAGLLGVWVVLAAPAGAQQNFKLDELTGFNAKVSVYGTYGPQKARIYGAQVVPSWTGYPRLNEGQCRNTPMEFMIVGPTERESFGTGFDSTYNGNAGSTPAVGGKTRNYTPWEARLMLPRIAYMLPGIAEQTSNRFDYFAAVVSRNLPTYLSDATHTPPMGRLQYVIDGTQGSYRTEMADPKNPSKMITYASKPHNLAGASPDPLQLIEGTWNWEPTWSAIGEADRKNFQPSQDYIRQTVLAHYAVVFQAKELKDYQRTGDGAKVSTVLPSLLYKQVSPNPSIHQVFVEKHRPGWWDDVKIAFVRRDWGSLWVYKPEAPIDRQIGRPENVLVSQQLKWDEVNLSAKVDLTPKEPLTLPHRISFKIEADPSFDASKYTWQITANRARDGKVVTAKPEARMWHRAVALSDPDPAQTDTRTTPYTAAVRETRYHLILDDLPGTRYHLQILLLEKRTHAAHVVLNSLGSSGPVTRITRMGVPPKWAEYAYPPITFQKVLAPGADIDEFQKVIVGRSLPRLGELSMAEAYKSYPHYILEVTAPK